jgi:pimeloyl-ACP methyl ester carboxylesterase
MGRPPRRLRRRREGVPHDGAARHLHRHRHRHLQVNGGINYYRANFAARLRRAWERKPYAREELIRVPTLFVYGEQDTAIVPETVRGVGDYIDAPYTEVRLGRSGHWVQQESPTEINAALLRFLAD